MTRQKSNDYLALDRLAASLVDDILRMTDEEILAEVAADGEDPKQIAQEAKGIFERAVTICGKSRLAAAKKAVLSDRQQGSKVLRLDPGTARQRLENILRQHPETRNKLTLAARNGDGLSDSDVLSMLEDLGELGVISLTEKQDDNE